LEDRELKVSAWESKQSQKRSIEEWEKLLERNRVGLLETEKQMAGWDLDIKTKMASLQQQEQKVKELERSVIEKERALTIKNNEMGIKMSSCIACLQTRYYGKDVGK
jgi:hypothetical protein